VHRAGDTVGASLCGVALLVDRSGGAVTFPAPTVSLLTLNVEKYAPDALPAWLAAIPIAQPGSTGRSSAARPRNAEQRTGGYEGRPSLVAPEFPVGATGAPC
jgi:hypothetical protein